MSGNPQVKRWIKAIDVRQKGVAKERDKLDSMIEELEMLKDCCDRAFDSLTDARDALSELV